MSETPMFGLLHQWSFLMHDILSQVEKIWSLGKTCVTH